MVWLRLHIFIFHRVDIFHVFPKTAANNRVKIVCTKYSIKDISWKEEISSIAHYCSICFLLACTDDISRRNLQRYSDDTDILFGTMTLLPSIDRISRSWRFLREDALCNTPKRRESFEWALWQEYCQRAHRAFDFENVREIRPIVGYTDREKERERAGFKNCFVTWYRLCRWNAEHDTRLLGKLDHDATCPHFTQTDMPIKD